MTAPRKSELKKAIERREVVPYFQPIVELRSRRLLGFEVLARWLHPERGLIYPAQFIPDAETNGLIGFLTESLLYQASLAAETWPTHLDFSINLSPLQLKDRNLALQLRDCVERTHLSMSRITIEITESALLGDLSTARSNVAILKDSGARLAIDDFGTGYSSLNHLRALPFDILKVDANFVRFMAKRREDRKIVAAVVGLGHSLGLITIAEGVEEQHQADMLQCLGCQIGQGWFYGKAVSAELAIEMIANAPVSPQTEFPAPNIAGDVAFQLEALPSQRLAQLQALYEGAPVGICFLDLQLRYVSLNKRLAEINGVPIEEHIGRTVAEVLPNFYEVIRPKLQAALAGEQNIVFEIAMGKRHLLAYYLPAKDEACEVIGISVAIVDITERKQIEIALRESEDHHRHTIELSPQVTWTSSPDGMLLDASQRWTLFTGLTREQTIGAGWLQAVHPHDAEPVMSAWTKSLRSGEPLDIEFRIRHQAGLWRWVRSRAAARRNEQGEIIRWYGSLEDITDRKKAEETTTEI